LPFVGPEPLARESRVAMQEMAQQWDRLADVTDLRQKGFNER